MTRDSDQRETGFLLPIYNVHDHFFASGKEPQQVYITVVAAGMVKGPYLHRIRTGYLTCIKGNVRFVVKADAGYECFFSGDDHEYLSVEIPTLVAMAIQNVGPDDAYVVNMPNPAWTPDMNDEERPDFSDFDFTRI